MKMIDKDVGEGLCAPLNDSVNRQRDCTVANNSVDYTVPWRPSDRTGTSTILWQFQDRTRAVVSLSCDLKTHFAPTHKSDTVLLPEQVDDPMSIRAGYIYCAPV